MTSVRYSVQNFYNKIHLKHCQITDRRGEFSTAMEVYSVRHLDPNIPEHMPFFQARGKYQKIMIYFFSQ